MSATGILIVILAIWILLNADKLAWVFMGQLKLNKAGVEGQPHVTSFNFLGLPNNG